MKKLLLIILIVFSSTCAASARDTEISLGYGALPAMKSLGVYHGHWKGIDTWGAFNASIDHRFAPSLWVGLNYTYSSGQSHHAVDNRYGEVTWHGLMVNARYEWLTSGRWTLFSHVGVGVLVEYYSPSWEESWNRTNMAFQLSPIGAQYELMKHAALFAEAGFGVQGIIKAGVRIGF